MIVDVNKQMSPFARRLLTELISRKQEEKKQEKRVIFCGWVSTAAWIILVGIFFLAANQGEYTVIEYMINSPYVLPLFVIAGGLTFYLTIVKKRYDEAEKDYKSLRNEIIERYDELWPTTVEANRRYETLEWLERVHGVNLFHQ
ncbi:hypothetical protein JCM19037_607 [Geomicrobium sp. JCM 19037]|uniref:DUF2663 family protein n=1 Tax=Geomicrobium sp. JCM 19037 TaxID=1460634 RepID=UPI00045F48E8|nr:DUF2663 family protein [Geomicrobium sp. JCM 19037]GAK02376.1 hypothetical protein JCM19037_607 [Geomicrobium sp. JCM 19037]